MSSLTQSLLSFLNDRGIGLDGLHGIGFDSTNTLYGESSAVQKPLWNNAPSALYVYCPCHQLQLAALHSANEHDEVKYVFGTLVAILKALHYSPMKAEKLIKVEAELNIPELKIGKCSNTWWLHCGDVLQFNRLEKFMMS